MANGTDGTVRIIYKDGEGEIVEKKSRFIATIPGV